MSSKKEKDYTYIDVVKMVDRGQIIIPYRLRELLDINKGDSMVFTMGENGMINIHKFSMIC